MIEEFKKVDGIEWIRLHYDYPTGFPSNVIELMNKNEKICSYIDMPLQHINDKILKSMRRSTTKKRTNELIKKIRKSKSNISISSLSLEKILAETGVAITATRTHLIKQLNEISKFLDTSFPKFNGLL